MTARGAVDPERERNEPVGVAAAAAIAASAAEKSDLERILPAYVVEAVRDAGFPAWFVGPPHGDGRGTFGELLRATAAVGEGCAAAAWYASLGAAVGRMAGHLPGPARDLVWAGGPDTFVAGALVPSGRAERVPGGWRLEGTWPFVSTIEHAPWALVRTTTVPERGPAESRFMLVERRDWETRDTWHVAGMRATASNTMEVRPVVVPSEHTFAADDMVKGRSPSPDPRLGVPLRAVNGLTLVAPMLGAARGALRSWAAVAGPKLAADTPDAFARGQEFARASVEVDSAGLLLERAAAVADTGRPGPTDVLRAVRDAAAASELLVAAVNRLVRTAGTGGQSDVGQLQRSWRDVTTASTHVMLSFGPAAHAYARSAVRPPLAW